MHPTLLAADHLPPATLSHARALRDGLAGLLARERVALADFLLALADFDARRGWEPLGHAGLFPFLKRELGLSSGAAHLRSTAARLMVRIPEVEAALRAGRLCLSSVGEAAKVLTPANQAEVLPRFFGLSFQEAREVAAALAPRTDPPRREVVTALPAAHLALPLAARPAIEPTASSAELAHQAAAAPAAPAAAPVRTSELPAPSPPARAPRLDDVQPLAADLSRLHLTVPRRLLDKLARARDGLSHALPGASTAQVLEVALDLLLEKQSRSRSLVKRPRARKAEAPPPANPRQVPAEVERQVWLRDEGRCQHPLDGGGVCGSTWQVEVDHARPAALGGPPTVENLRLRCRPHNQQAAREALGAAVVGRRAKRHRPDGPASHPRRLEPTSPPTP